LNTASLVEAVFTLQEQHSRQLSGDMLPPSQASALPGASRMHIAAAEAVAQPSHVSAVEGDRDVDATISAPAAVFSPDFNGEHYNC